MIDAEVLGYTVLNTGPVSCLHIERTAGLSVLYGLNGAGKSSILRSLRDGLTGVSGGAQTHIKTHDPFVPCDEDPFDLRYALLSAGCEAMDNGTLELKVRAPWDPSEFRLDTDAAKEYASPGSYFLEQLNLGEAVRALIDWDLIDEPSDDRARMALAQDIASAGIFTLTPVGSLDAPCWKVTVGARFGDDSPLIDQVLASRDRDSNQSRNVSEVDAREALERLLDEPTVPGSSLLHDASSFSTFDVARPRWVPHGIAYFGELGTSSWVWPPRVLGESSSAETATRNFLIRRTDPWDGLFEAVVEEAFDVRPEVAARIRELNDEVNSILGALVVDAPFLALELEHPNRWLEGASPFRWTAIDPGTLDEVPLMALSDFQLRWARFAIGLATTTPGDADAILLVDEPERAAHPQSIERLATGLTETARRLPADILIATHSPSMLDDSGGRLLHVARDGTGHTAISPLEPFDSKDLDRMRTVFGLSPSDLLQQTRCFLVAEGEHDVATFEELIGDELARLRVQIVAMRGTKNLLSLLDAQFLLNFTTASFTVVADNVAAGKVRKAYDMLLDQTTNAGLALRSLRSGTSEEQTVAELLSGAQQAGCLDRIAVFGLRERDIIRYLPASAFLDDAPSWADVDARRDRSLDFKAAIRALGGTVSTSAVRRAAKQMDSIPSEFTKLLAVCSGESTRRSQSAAHDA